ncbi:hypothetical protein EB796_019223 [Bugula neritina]|uniref:Uncharacterized protein n=1 Tax=Bugula neritina TaxID=10212 RepID=A0A7J7J8C8_BUGNE|nr:hypothetical protein EB796_019223 [Bugula neritina]
MQFSLNCTSSIKRRLLICILKGREMILISTSEQMLKNSSASYWLGPHEKLHRSHKTLTIQEYRANANKMKVRFCDKHEDQPYNVGCKDCLSLCCVKCLSGLKNCTSTGKDKPVYRSRCKCRVFKFLGAKSNNFG